MQVHQLPVYAANNLAPFNYGYRTFDSEWNLIQNIQELRY